MYGIIFLVTKHLLVYFGSCILLKMLKAMNSFHMGEKHTPTNFQEFDD